MKNILALILIAFVIASCGSKKELVVEVPSVEEAQPAPQRSDRKIKKPKIDAEQLAAQLGLSEAQEKEFLAMWDKTSEDMKNARNENRGDRDALLSKMMEVRDQRQAELKRILTDAQMTKYHEIMDANRKKMGGAPVRHGGG